MNQGKVTLRSIRNDFHEELENLYDAHEINSILYILFEDLLGWPRTKLHLEPGYMPDLNGVMMFRNALDRLKRGCPLQYITGKAFFNELQMKVNASVLIPRPETAEMVKLILQNQTIFENKGFTAIDIGTGSGCIAIYLKKHKPLISMHATDISEDALAVARSNAAAQETEIEFLRSDILSSGHAPACKKFDLIVSNPPYVTMKEMEMMKQNVKDYEPFTALFVPDSDPLKFYRAIAGFATRSLDKDGMLWIEINEAYGNELKELLAASGFSYILLLKDFRSRDRFIRAEFRNH